jgi:hypothetical protein
MSGAVPPFSHMPNGMHMGSYTFMFLSCGSNPENLKHLLKKDDGALRMTT